MAGFMRLMQTNYEISTAACSDYLHYSLPFRSLLLLIFAVSASASVQATVALSHQSWLIVDIIVACPVCSSDAAQIFRNAAGGWTRLLKFALSLMLSVGNGFP